MRVGTVQGQTLSVALVIAAAAFGAAALAGYPVLGAGIAAGLVIGGLNGFSIQAVIDRRAPILVTSVMRLSLFTMLALAGARLLGGSVWPVVVGIVIAQFVMVAVGVRQGSRP